jgi:hypothetical protein
VVSGAALVSRLSGAAHITSLALRLMAFDTRTLIAGDVKGEYAALCRHLENEPLLLGPGLPGRLNPLDAGPLGQGLADQRARGVRRCFCEPTG